MRIVGHRTPAMSDADLSTPKSRENADQDHSASLLVEIRRIAVMDMDASQAAHLHSYMVDPLALSCLTCGRPLLDDDDNSTQTKTILHVATPVRKPSFPPLRRSHQHLLTRTDRHGVPVVRHLNGSRQLAISTDSETVEER